MPQSSTLSHADLSTEGNVTLEAMQLLTLAGVEVQTELKELLKTVTDPSTLIPGDVTSLLEERQSALKRAWKSVQDRKEVFKTIETDFKEAEWPEVKQGYLEVFDTEIQNHLSTAKEANNSLPEGYQKSESDLTLENLSTLIKSQPPSLLPYYHYLMTQEEEKHAQITGPNLDSELPPVVMMNLRKKYIQKKIEDEKNRLSTGAGE